MRTLRAEPLTAAAFAPFGDVLEASTGHGKAANQGTAVRQDRLGRLAHDRPGATPNLAVFRARAQSLPWTIKLLERHPRSSQAFVPMVVERLLIIVAPALPDGAPDLAGLRAFLTEPGQGVNYLLGVWHHPMVALDAAADLAMLAWEDGSAEDCVEHWLSEPIEVVGL